VALWLVQDDVQDRRGDRRGMPAQRQTAVDMAERAAGGGVQEPVIDAPLVLRRDADVGRMEPHADDPECAFPDLAVVDECRADQSREHPLAGTCSADHSRDVVVAPQCLSLGDLDTFLVGRTYHPERVGCPVGGSRQRLRTVRKLGFHRG